MKKINIILVIVFITALMIIPIKINGAEITSGVYSYYGEKSDFTGKFHIYAPDLTSQSEPEDIDYVVFMNRIQTLTGTNNYVMIINFESMYIEYEDGQDVIYSGNADTIIVNRTGEDTYIFQFKSYGELKATFTIDHIVPYNNNYPFIVMTTSSQQYYDEGYEAGYDEGETGGYSNGYQAGETAGYDSGYQAGLEISNNVDYNDGYEDGYEAGYDEGETGGYSNGYLAGETYGYSNGYEAGETYGYSNGYEAGEIAGYHEGYQAGLEISNNADYNEGFEDGISHVYIYGLDGFINPNTNLPYDVTLSYLYALGHNSGESVGQEEGFNRGYNEGYLIGSQSSNTGDSGAYIAGYPPSIASYYKLDLFMDYFYMTTGKITIDQEMKTLIVYVPNFDFIVTSGGTGTEQNVTFFDINNNVISRVPVFGRLFGWFTYNIPNGTVKVEHQVLNKGSVPTNYVSEWNKQAYISYGDNLEVYQTAWNEGYNDGKNDGINVGKIEGYKDGKADGIIIGEIAGYDVGFIEAVSSVYYDGFIGIINPDTNLPYDVTNSFPYGQGWDKGYNEGVASQSDFSFTGIIFQVFAGLGALLTIELLPNITIGAIVAVPLVFGIIYFILGKRSGE